MSQRVVTLTPTLDTGRAAKMRNIPEAHKPTLRDLHAGHVVPFESALIAVFYAMKASVTANGQSMKRREDSERIERLWLRIHLSAGVPMGPVGLEAPEDLTSPEEIESWLAS